MLIAFADGGRGVACVPVPEYVLEVAACPPEVSFPIPHCFVKVLFIFTARKAFSQSDVHVFQGVLGFGIISYIQERGGLGCRHGELELYHLENHNPT